MTRLRFAAILLTSALIIGSAIGQTKEQIKALKVEKTTSLRDELPDSLAKKYKKKGGLNFLIFGDWGRNGYFNQQDVADQMGYVSEAAGSAFIISAGDNFQINGIRSVNDPLWQSTYENVYKHPSLEKDWYVVLGNHDYHGNPQAEVDYTKISRRWNMPSRYYAVHKKLGEKDSTAADFYFLDTPPLQEMYHNNQKQYSDLDQQDTAAQLKWLDSALTASKSRWKIVVGHHPVYSNGDHGQKDRDIQIDMPARFAKFFASHGVDAYFCGHDHDFEYIRQTDSPVNYFVIGNGSAVRPVEAGPSTVFCKSIPGFTSVSLSKDTMTVNAIDYKGNIFYSVSIPKPVK